MALPYKPTLCVDFDGVLHSYSSGWQGADIVSDPPVPGAIEFLVEATKHFTVVIHSSRSHQPGGIEAMQNWLLHHFGLWHHFRASGMAEDARLLENIQWPNHKPSAFVTLDDRAITFEGTFPDPQSLLDFKPWNKK